MRLVGKLMVAWGLWRLFGPEIEPRFVGPQVNPMRIPGRTVFVDNREMFVREAGNQEAETIVLVHGWGDASNVVYARLLPKLAERFHVIAIDNRDSGKSDAVRSDYSIADAADDIAAVIDQLEVGPCAVFGYSMGGMIVQELVRTHPLAVSRFALAGTAARAVDPALGALRTIGLYVARAFERFSRSEVSYARTKYLRAVGAIADDEMRHFWLQSVNRDPELYWQAGFAATAFDSTTWVGDLELSGGTPLVVVNTADQLVMPKHQYDLASRVVGASVVELVGARHEAPLTHSDEMVAAIADWLEPRT